MRSMGGGPDCPASLRPPHTDRHCRTSPNECDGAHVTFRRHDGQAEQMPRRVMHNRLARARALRVQRMSARHRLPRRRDAHPRVARAHRHVFKRALAQTRAMCDVQCVTPTCGAQRAACNAPPAASEARACRAPAHAFEHRRVAALRAGAWPNQRARVTRAPWRWHRARHGIPTACPSSATRRNWPAPHRGRRPA